MPSPPPHHEAAFTDTERALDHRVHAWLAHAPRTGWKAWAVELAAFTAKQAWACVFGGAMLALVLAARLWWPDDAALARNDALTLAALAIQIIMVATRLETLRGAPGGGAVPHRGYRHGTLQDHGRLVGLRGRWRPTAGAGSPLLRLHVRAVGSYLVRVYRLFNLRFERYPRQWLTAVVAAAIYVNFFTHHYIADLRWPITAAVVVVFGRCVMHFRVFRRHLRMPLLCAFGLVAVFIWLAENIATWSHAWTYPNQAEGWHPVSVSKLGSWFLLMIISVVLVAWVYPPRPATRRGPRTRPPDGWSPTNPSPARDLAAYGSSGVVGKRGSRHAGVPGHRGSRPHR